MQNEDFDDFERIVNEIDLGHIKHIYGIWSGTESRLRLYLYLIIMSIYTGIRVLELQLDKMRLLGYI